MGSPDLAVDELVNLCLSDKTEQAFCQSISAHDLNGSAIVGFFDKPSYARLEALRELNGGDAVAIAVATAVLLADFDQDTREHVRNLLQDHGESLALGGAPAERLLKALTDGDERLDDQFSATAFGWLAAHQKQPAIDLARESVATSDSALTHLLTAELDCLGSSANADDHAVAIAFAGRRAIASDNVGAARALGSIDLVLGNDITPLATVLSALVNGGQPVPAELRGLFERLDGGGITRLLPLLNVEEARAPHFNSQLLPHIFAAHAPTIASLIAKDFWHHSSQVWLTDNAPWHEHDDALLPSALRTATQSENEGVAERLRARLAARVGETATESGSSAKLPRLGVQSLLAQALDGVIAPDHPSLDAALRHLEADDRAEEYLRANWKRRSRASRLAQILAQVEESDVSEAVVARAFELDDSALAAWILPVVAIADDEHAQALVAKAEGRPVVLSAIALAQPGQVALIRVWEESDDLEAFRSFEDSGCDDPRILDHVPVAVRNYGNALSTEERIDLLDRLGPEDLQEIVQGIISDRKADSARRPAVDLLALSIDRLVPDADLNEEMAELCRNHLNVEVRTAAYEFLGRSTPTTEVVALLVERQEAERPELLDAVEAAMDAVASALAHTVASTTGATEAESLELLDEIDPARALPHARRILDDEVEEPGHRVLAAQILGSHGTSDDAARLKSTAAKEPNGAVQQALQHAIRRLEIGDIADAHLRLGELAGVNPAIWDDLDPATIWGDKEQALVVALERVAKHESNGDRESTVDQIGAELSKLVLYHTIDRTGDELGLKERDRVAIATNSLEFGGLLVRQQILTHWPFVSSLNELYRLRTEHLSPKGTWEPNNVLTDEEYTMALALFKRGIEPCLSRLARNPGDE